MNRYIFFILCVFCGCGVFKKNFITSTKNVDFVVVHANLISHNLSGEKSKIKTKIKITPDTVTASIYPLLGLELGKIIITTNKIFIHNKYSNQNDSILFNTRESINLRNFQKSFFQKNLKQDTILYKNSYQDFFFTNYISSELFMKDNKVVFVPTKIFFENDSLDYASTFGTEISIEYKSIVFYTQKK